MKLMILCLLCGTVFGLSAKAQRNMVPLPVVINGTTYSLTTNAVVATMVHGQGNKYFEVTIHGEGNYGFSVYGYGVGFPTYEIIADTESGGADGDARFKLYFNDSCLMPEGNKPKTYSGYIPIHIYQGSERGDHTNFLHLPVTLTVYPVPSTNAPVK